MHYQGPLVFYAITLIVIIQLVQLFNYDIQLIYNLRSSLDDIFALKDKGTSSNITYFDTITSRNQFYKWFDQTVNNTYRSSSMSSKTLFANKTVILGDAALFKYETKDRDCPAKIAASNIRCIYTEYTDATKSRIFIIKGTEDLLASNGSILPWGKFRTNQDVGVTFVIDGNVTTYASGGYVVFLGNSSTTREEVSAKIGNISSFITDNTLAFSFVMSGYILDLDYFYSIDLLIERTPTGSFQPSKVMYDIFRPTLSWNYTFNVVGDIIIYVLTIIQVSLNIKAVIFD